MPIDNNEKNKYKLFGTMNIFNIIPDFVYPVFINNGKYYFQNSSNSIEINSFYEITGKERINKIKPLPSTVNVKEYYMIGDEPLVAFQTNEESYFIGTIDAFNEFINKIKIEDEILSKNISKFQNEVQVSKTLKKDLNKKHNFD